MSESRFTTRTVEGSTEDLHVWDNATGHVLTARGDEAEQIVASLETAEAERTVRGSVEASVAENGYTVTVTESTSAVTFDVPEVADTIAGLDVAEAVRQAEAERDAALRETLQDFATWPTKPQALALEALVAAHGAVQTRRVSAGGDEFDYLRVTWGSLAYAVDGGALLDALGELVQPSDPQTITVGLPLDVLAGVLGRDTLLDHLETLREKAQAKGDGEVSTYAVDTPLAEAVIKALRDAATLRARTVEFLATLEAQLNSALDSGAGGTTEQDAETVRELLTELLPA